MAKKIIYNVTG